MKMHLNLATKDLPRSVDFYRTLLSTEPVKHFADYALFVVENPGLELALDRDPHAAPRDHAHYGVVVDSEDAVLAATERLTAAGFPTALERDETCCYARQSKVWSTDPDGRRWETYVVHEDMEHRDGAGTAATACCNK